MKFTTNFGFEATDAAEAEKVVKDFFAFMTDRVASPHIMLPSPVAEVPPAAAMPAIVPGDKPVVVYTDGGCHNSHEGGLGAWAFLVLTSEGKVHHEDANAYQGTTNNRMELMAVIAALEGLEIGPAIKVVSDSEYVIKGTTVWSRNWVKNGWLTGEGKKVKNRDLWEKLIALYQLHDVQFQWVKGHAGDPHNDRVDNLCTDVMVQAHKKLLSGDARVAVDHGAKTSR